MDKELIFSELKKVLLLIEDRKRIHKRMNELSLELSNINHEYSEIVDKINKEIKAKSPIIVKLDSGVTYRVMTLYDRDRKIDIEKLDVIEEQIEKDIEV